MPAQVYHPVSGPKVQLIQFRARGPEPSPEWPAFSLATLWPRLAGGELVIRGHSTTDELCSLVLAGGSGRPSRTLNEGQVSLARTLLVGGCQKVLAIERNLCASTISAGASRCLQALGLDCSVTRAPLALSLAALAAGADRLTPSVAWWRPSRDGEMEVWVPRPDESLRASLSEAEFEIARLVMQGLCHQEIAARRDRSERTIANQVHSVFSKLRVSGRFQLIALAVELQRSPVVFASKQAS
jgi:DNA-binding NarL/FixJ family response regulator